MYEFDTERLQLRRLQLADAPKLFSVVGDPEVMKYWIGGADQNTAQTEKRIQYFQDHWFSHQFGDWGVINKMNGHLIGFAGLHYIKGMTEVNIGYVLEKQIWRQGYGSEICRFIIRFGFEQLGLSEIIAVIWPENEASIRLVKKNGLVFWKEIIWGGSKRLVYKIEKP